VQRRRVDAAEEETSRESSDEPDLEGFTADRRQVGDRREYGRDEEQSPRVHPLGEVGERRDQRAADKAELHADRQPGDLSVAEAKLVRQRRGDGIAGV